MEAISGNKLVRLPVRDNKLRSAQSLIGVAAIIPVFHYVLHKYITRSRFKIAILVCIIA